MTMVRQAMFGTRLEVENGPTSPVFNKGHRMRLDIQQRDGIGGAARTHYHADCDAGADKFSHLLLAIVPEK